MELYDLFGDTQSKFIFQNRKAFSLTGNDAFLQEIVDKTVRNRREWIDFRQELLEKSEKSELLIFGAGIWGKILWVETHDIVNWKLCIDSSPQGKDFPIPVADFRDFICGYKDEYIAISSYKNFGSMYEQLIEAGISEEKFIRAGDVINMLTEGSAYFDLENLLPVREPEVFIDGGCFDGFTTKAFFRWSKGKGRAFCFEIDDRNIALIRKNLSDSAAYEIIPKALWSVKKRLSLSGPGNYSSSVFDDICESCVSVEADTIDFLMRDKRVSYIKLDIEGAELEALKGAKRVIQEQSPRLAVSIYHKREDIWTIPTLIHEYNPHYKFYLRHYSFSWYDTVLYAVQEES